MLYQKKIKELNKVYDEIAEKYFLSRKKFRSEGEFILKEIKSELQNKKTLKILDLGTGGGRVWRYLKENLTDSELQKIKFTGIDFSQKLIKLAKKEYPEAKFTAKDMLDFLQNSKFLQYDFIIFANSFQHIYPNKKRELILDLSYKVLKYAGKLIMINRSFSNWFIKKYWFQIIKSFFTALLSFGKVQRNDLFIPWKLKNKKFQRYYHIFTTKELKNLIFKTGFVINFCGKSKNNRNTICIAEKKVFLD